MTCALTGNLMLPFPNVVSTVSTTLLQMGLHLCEEVARMKTWEQKLVFLDKPFLALGPMQLLSERSHLLWAYRTPDKGLIKP